MDCIRLSQKLGFKKFEFVRNARYNPNNFHYKTGKPLDIQPWDQDKKFNRIHATPNSVALSNCMHLSIPSIYLTATGQVTPCCYMDKGPLLSSVDIKEEFSNNVYRKVCLLSCG